MEKLTMLALLLVMAVLQVLMVIVAGLVVSKFTTIMAALIFVWVNILIFNRIRSE